jgi:hypothetical protein
MLANLGIVVSLRKRVDNGFEQFLLVIHRNLPFYHFPELLN